MSNKKVLVYGASGGLGNSIINKFYNKGYDVVISGRNYEKLMQIKEKNGIDGEIKVFSITEDIDPSIFEDVDIIINATGIDVRKPIRNQSLTDIKSQLDLNLFGAINLTKTVLKTFTKKGKGQILHIGGFADGSWAMPYYTVDIATRSGIYSFIESINLEIDNRKIQVQYFCPQPADTDAERPYHKLWKKQGIKITSKEKVSQDILRAIESSKSVTIQGGLFNSFISTKLKYLFPKVFKKYVIMPMGRQTMTYLDNIKEE
ncbi:MAG: SDR family NAD(P)-dependent oxidoreductase [Spirochaetaceae bacterium]